jgi:beta-mannosidase
MATVRTFAGPADLNIASPVMESHQKNKGGNARIAETMFRYFRFPMTFEDFVYLSQVQHGLAMRTAVEYWRTLKPHCMGALYWQLNDTWPVASWSGLDHGGGWKALHYMARQFFAPVAVFAVPSGEDIVLSGVNDGPHDVPVEVSYFAVSVDGRRTDLGKLAATLPTDRAMELVRVPAAAIPEDSFLHISVRHDGQETQRLHFAPRPYKTYALHDPEIAIRHQVSNGALLITLQAGNPTYFVSLESDEPGHFDDNAFDLLPGEARTIRFTPHEAGGAKRAADSLTIRNLHSSTQR